MEKKWWHSSVVYQVYPRSFSDSNGDGIGDIPGIISKLDYLQNLGIDVIWLSPVYKSPMDDNGYDISDYEDIAAEFGTLADMDNLIAEGHKRGIKIVMDLVVNHTSDEHPWFIEAKKSKDNPYRDYYIWRDVKEDGSLPNDLESIFLGPAWLLDETTNQYMFHLFSKRQPDLNWQNPKVHDEVFGMMNRWLEKGIGGFRLDVIDLIGKDIDKGITGNGPTLHNLLQKMNKATFGNYDVLTVGETWGATPEIAKLYSNPDRNELSMVFQFEHITLYYHETEGKWGFRAFDFIQLKEIMEKWQTSLGDEGWNSLFWSNHDLPRIVSKFGDPVNYRVESAKMLGTILHMMKGTPYIYQGEELGMTNVKFDSIDDYDDIETLNAYKEKVTKGEMSHEDMMACIYENSRDNARTPMHWNNKAHGGFTSGKPWLKVNPNYPTINAEAAMADETSVFHHYKALIKLRRENPVIVYGDFKLYEKKHPSLFVYTRTLDDVTFLVINNFSGEMVSYTHQDPVKGEVLLSNYNKDYDDLRHLNLEPYESIVIKL